MTYVEMKSGTLHVMVTREGSNRKRKKKVQVKNGEKTLEQMLAEAKELDKWLMLTTVTENTNESSTTEYYLKYRITKNEKCQVIKGFEYKKSVYCYIVDPVEEKIVKEYDEYEWECKKSEEFVEENFLPSIGHLDKGKDNNISIMLKYPEGRQKIVEIEAAARVYQFVMYMKKEKIVDFEKYSVKTSFPIKDVAELPGRSLLKECGIAHRTVLYVCSKD